MKIIGGVKISAGSKDGIGAIVIKSGADNILLTAGHVVGAVGTKVSSGGMEIGVVSENFLPDNDIAYVKLNADIEVGLNEVRVGFETYTDVKLATTLPPEGADVVLAGDEANFGTVLIPQADITVGGEKIKNVSVANYFSEDGDSGAAILRNGTDPEATLWGIHGGQFIAKHTTRRWFTPIVNIELAD